MPAPLSTDLRTRILQALVDEPSSLIVAERFDVSASGVRKLRARYERTGKIDPDPLPGRDRLVSDEVEQRLHGLVRENPDATLALLCELLDDETGVSVSETTMWRQLLRMGITLKKKHSMPRSRTGRT